MFLHSALLVNGDQFFLGLTAVCGAPKRRFREYTPPVTKDANSLDVRKARKEQIKRDEAVG